MKSQRTVRVGATLTVVALLAACGGGGGQSAESGDDLKRIRVASLTPTVFTVGLPHYVAEDQDFYADAGLAVEAIFTDGGGANVQTVASGNADIARQTGTVAVLSAVSNGADLQIISSGYRGIDGLWLTAPDGAATDLESLAGQKVGYTSPGSASDVGVRAFSEILESRGLPALEGEAIGGTPDQLTAMSTGQIAAAYTNPPVGMDLILDGDLIVALNAFEDLPDYADVSTRVAFGSSEFIENNPDVIDAWIEAMTRTWDWIFDNQEQAAQIWIEAGELDLSEDEVLSTFDYYTRDMVGLFPVSGIDKSVEDGLASDGLGQELTTEQLDELIRPQN